MQRIALGGVHGEGKFALVDDDMYDELNQYSWFVEHGYAARKEWSDELGKQVGISMARQIMNPPDRMEVDHIDHQEQNNQRHNLRVCTHAENQRNARKHTHRRGVALTSQYKGVSWHRATKKWQVHIRVDRKGIYLGMFDDEIVAARVYDVSARWHFGEFADCNFEEVECSLVS